MPSLSVLVIAHNEEARLAECLSRLAFADEIVVMLDRTTDRSKEIAEAHGARVVEGAWEIEGIRRMAAIDACQGPWILEVDADEWIGPELGEEISMAVSGEFDFHFMPMRNYVQGRWIKHGWMAALAPDLKGSLFRKGRKTWEGKREHPGVSFEGTRGPDLTHGIQHNLADDLSSLIRRFNRNTSLRAQDMVDQGAHARTPTMVRKIFSRFWKCYVARRGHKEGGVGMLISILAAIYPLIAHLKAQELRASRTDR